MRENINELKKYLPKDWKEKCKELKALVRGREIKTPEELLELNLLYLTMGGSFGTTSALLKLTTDAKMSKKAVYTRIQNSGEWLKWMSREMCSNNGLILPKPEWLTKNVILVDGSELSVKGSRCGDYMLHYTFDLFNFKSCMELTGISKGESLLVHQFDKNDIVIGDRGYVSIKGMEHVKSFNADFILRYRKNAFKIFDEDGNEIDILSKCKNVKALENTSFSGYYRIGGGKRPVRIVIMRKDKEAESKAIRKIKRKHSKNQLGVPREDTIELNKFIILATSLDYSEERILELYRTRWQIEQVFYRLKSLFDFGDVPSKKAETVKAWFYGKLFLAVLSETILKTESFSPEDENFMRSADIIKLVE